MINFFKSRKFWKRALLILVLLPLLLLSVNVAVVYYKQDAIVQYLLEEVNKDFRGSLELEGSHISLFENFPYISVDLEGVTVYEDKQKNTTPIVEVADLYLGFNIWAVLQKRLQIKNIKVKDGSFHIIQHLDGEFNIVRALSGSIEDAKSDESISLNLNSIEFQNIDLTKQNEANNILAEAYIYNAISKFSTSPNHVAAALDARFELNLIVDNDTTFIKHKMFELATEMDFTKDQQMLTLAPTVVKLGGAEFNMSGTIDFLHEMLLDLEFRGNKPNFELFIAMAPEELIPTLRTYENSGQIFFEASVKGKSLNGNKPAINARFGCENAFFNNRSVNKKIDELNFAGHFSNGEKRDITTMEFGIEDFRARPEAGKFGGKLLVKNFQSPEIELQVDTEFELDFLAKFANLTNLSDPKGKVFLTMNFRDIIDLEFPERSIEQWNEAYAMHLRTEDLSFTLNSYPLPFKQVNLNIAAQGHKAELTNCRMIVGGSDLNVSGFISDLPAILHHTSTPVESKLKIESKKLDLFELTGSDSLRSINEQIKNLSLGFTFNSSAKAFTESPHLPKGEFFIDELYADLQHYPHTLHDFHADIIVGDEDLQVIDVEGMIDKSDFLFSGRLGHYDLLYAEDPLGDAKIEFDLSSKLLQLEDLFSYQGENFVPEEYRHEEFSNLHVHGYTDLHFKKGLRSLDLFVDKFDTKMKVHPMRFENFRGRIHYEDEHLMIEDFSGKIGHTDFQTTLHYYTGKNEEVKKRDNHLELTATRVDFDELFLYNPAPSGKIKDSVNHDAGFNIYELPFTDMTYHFDVGHLNYHRYKIDNLKGVLRTNPNHYLYVDTLHFQAAGGSFDINGYFNGSNPEAIYFSPNMRISNVDLDKLLFKFENFGQDHLVSENLHGQLSGTVTGKIHMHNDLVPKIDDSEIHLDINVINGRLENFVLLDELSDYFSDKNLRKVYFDTLSNKLDLKNGVLQIPEMTVSSSLGFIKISGKQDMKMNHEYYLRVPWKLVTQAAASKLFGKKNSEVDPEQIDAIQYADPEKNVKYVNIEIKGTASSYNVSLGKDKAASSN